MAELLSLLGSGVHPQDASVGGMDSIRATCGGAMYLLGESMGVTVDDLKVEAEVFVSPKDYTSPGGFTVNAGSIGAFWFKLIGISSVTERFVITHVTRMGWDMAPDWPMLGEDGGYRVEIDSYPPLRADLPMALPGGRGSACCVNSVEAVVKASPVTRRTSICALSAASTPS